ncbi:MAG TPA: TIGR00180 family glycosyltransferase [Bryobacteraceae bacterium]|nr:TIGR00180 family glycosyltransferase [Bryobacteraceae bacterium]
MARLLIPTRNRPTSLAGVLEFLRTFYPKAEVIIADGSEEHHKAQNRVVVDGFHRAPGIDYRPYPYELPFFDRLLDVLRSENDSFFIMGSDDDFPMLDVLNQGEWFLRQHDDYVTALGPTIYINLSAQGGTGAVLVVARQIAADSAERRIAQFAQWIFATTYAVTRREHLIERYERARTQFLIGFHDFMVGAHDCLVGKIRVLPSLGFVGTRNHNHSYIRPETGLSFLRRAQDVLGLAATLEADLQALAGMEPAAAARLSEALITRRIGMICGNPPHLKAGFRESNVFRHATVQAQFELFENLFRPDNAIRARYEDKLQFISAALRRSAASQDNKDEPTFVETLDDQIHGRSSNPGAVPRARDYFAVPPPRSRTDRLDKIDMAVRLDPETMLEMAAEPAV